MGLDMYLNAELYLWNEDKELKEKIKGIFKNSFDLSPDKVTFEVMYWRKCNAIHKWFVDNVQDGVDDCKNYYVTVAQLQLLLKLVKDVLRNRRLAEKLLPTQQGFFFGSTDYDEWYFDNLKKTKQVLTKLLKTSEKEMKKLEFYYHSSW